MEILLLPLLAIIILSLPLVGIIRGKKSGKKAKRAIIMNLCSFFGVLALAVILPLGGALHAETAKVAVDAASVGLGYLAAALSTGLGSIGCGIAVGSAAPAAIGAVSEEPKAFSKALIFVALGEGVALYGFLISFMIIGKL
ncbi:MAG: ATP synthase subunit C [Oscillospiraceae bacterium]